MTDIILRYNWGDHDILIYTDKMWRFTDDGPDRYDYFLARDVIRGNIFYYRYSIDGDTNWMCDWAADNKEEIDLANAIADAEDRYKADIIIDDLLRGN